MTPNFWNYKTSCVRHYAIPRPLSNWRSAVAMKPSPGNSSVAVTDWAQRYQQCNQPAGTPVVLYGHQQAEFAVALYSCLLHNIPYIPVDCIYPQERLKEICQLANALLL
jgi:hypothetical protein